MHSESCFLISPVTLTLLSALCSGRSASSFGVLDHETCYWMFCVEVLNALGYRRMSPSTSGLMESVVDRCELDHLQLNISKTKQVVVDLKRSRIPTISIMGEMVEMFASTCLPWLKSLLFDLYFVLFNSASICLLHCYTQDIGFFALLFLAFVSCVVACTM